VLLVELLRVYKYEHCHVIFFNQAFVSLSLSPPLLLPLSLPTSSFVKGCRLYFAAIILAIEKMFL
jgi:hypothetical protein